MSASWVTDLAYSKPIGMSWHFQKQIHPVHFCTVAATSNRIIHKINYQVSQIIVFEVLQIRSCNHTVLDTYQNDDYSKSSMRMKKYLLSKRGLIRYD